MNLDKADFFFLNFLIFVVAGASFSQRPQTYSVAKEKFF